MARYFFHYRNGHADHEDDDGLEFESLEAAKDAALHGARDTLSQEILNGVMDLRYRLEVEDERRDVIHVLQFADAVEVIR